MRKISFFSLVASFIFLTSFSAFSQFIDEDRNYLPGEMAAGKKKSSLAGTGNISLTFDDGPCKYTLEVLKVLRNHNLKVAKKNRIKATFFVLGKNINKRTIPIIEQIYKDGHIVATHDFDHRNNNRELEDEFKAGLKKAVLMLEKIKENVKKKFGIDAPEMYFRFPYGDYGRKNLDEIGGPKRKDIKEPNELSYHHFNAVREVSNDIYGENCIVPVYWDLDSLDYKYRSAWRTMFQIRAVYKIHNGGIMLMHDLFKSAASTVKKIIKYAKKKNIKFVPLNEIEEFKYKNKRCKPVINLPDLPFLN